MAQVMRCLREQAKAAALYRSWAARLYSAQPSPVPGEDEAKVAVEAMRANDAMIVQLKNRPFSPFISLQQTTIQLREPFSPHDRPQRPLSHLLKATAPGTIAARSDLCRPHTRALVDVYAFIGEEQNGYELVVSSLDLMSFLWGQDMRLTLAPGDVKDATAPVSAATQSSNEVMMVAPTAFGFNEQTALDNHFMHAAAQAGESDTLVDTVTKEFAGLHHELSEVHGVHINLMQHNLAHGTPDAVFPNNWFSTHAAEESLEKKSAMVLYPMKCPNRAAERRPDLMKLVSSRGYDNVVDMTDLETKKEYFEGTGVLVLDRVNGVAYVSTSERADKAAAEEWVRQVGYSTLVTFQSQDRGAHPIYHTNVMMAVGSSVAVVCGESIADSQQRKHLFATLGNTHEIIDISSDQMDSFCGNVLELEDGRGLPIMAMSTQAYNAFTEDQRKTILRHCATIAHAPVDTIERVGGGGVRCMLAELF